MQFLGVKKGKKFIGEIRYCNKFEKCVFFAIMQKKGGLIRCVSFEQSIINNIFDGMVVEVLDFQIQNNRKVNRTDGSIGYEVRVIVNFLEILEDDDPEAPATTNVANFLDNLLEQEDKKNEEEAKKELEELINWD